MLIGIERGSGGKPAGVRTMSLVAMGAALFTSIGKLGNFGGDGSRMAAQVASGVGFVGAGVIRMREQAAPHRDKTWTGERMHNLKGITTACSIWVSAGIGVAAGCGFDIVAFVATGITLAYLWSYRLLYMFSSRRAGEKTKGNKPPIQALAHPDDD